MLSDEELDVIGMLLTYACRTDTFAFYAVKGEGKRKYKIYYALPYTANGGVEWSAPLLILQHMSSLLSDTPRPILYLGNGAQPGNAGEGILRFFEMQSIRHFHRERYIPKLINSINWFMQEWDQASFHPIDPLEIINRSELDAFIPQNLGPVPNVNLGYNNQSTHLHRLYMALAFHRVRRKFDLNETGHKIAAVLVDRSNGRVCAIAHNTRQLNPTFHAEVNLVQASLKADPYNRNGPFMLYSTLKPCPMCAAMIAQYLPDAMVFYGQGDSGGHMKALEDITCPKFYLPLDNSWQHKDLVKPLRSWGEEYEDRGNRSHYEKQGRFEGQNTDVYTHLGGLHDTMKGKFHYGENNQKVHPWMALTLNLEKPVYEKAIRNAARTLDRKMNQYVRGGKPEPHYNDYMKHRRYGSIMKVMQHIQPLIEQV